MEVINILCRLNLAEIVLFPHLTETHVGLESLSIYHLDAIQKHTGTIVTASDHQYF